MPENSISTFLRKLDLKSEIRVPRYRHFVSSKADDDLADRLISCNRTSTSLFHQTLNILSCILAVSQFKSEKALQREVCREEACWQLKAWVYELPGRQEGPLGCQACCWHPQANHLRGGVEGGGEFAVITSLLSHREQPSQDTAMYTRNMRKGGGKLS